MDSISSVHVHFLMHTCMRHYSVVNKNHVSVTGAFTFTCIKIKEYGWWKTGEHADRSHFVPGYQLEASPGTTQASLCSGIILLK